MLLRRLVNFNMKKQNENRMASSYWQEVLALFSKAGAFGVVNLFMLHRHEINMDRTVKAIDNNQSSLLLPGEDELDDSFNKLQEIA
jgi:hypothetical protein